MNKMEIKFDALSQNESFARLAVSGFLLYKNPSVNDMEDIKMAVSEAVTNSIIHGYDNEGTVRIYCEIEDNDFMVEIEDYGKGIENIELARKPLYTTKASLERSGMGFTIMESFMDKVEIHKLIEQAQQGDENALETLISKNTGLIWSIVKRFTGRGVENEDLYQLGAMGLVKAVKKFDLSYNVRLSTYAVPMICGEIKRFLRDDGIIKISRGIKETAFKIMRAREGFRSKYGREPDIKELSEYTGINDEDIVLALNSMRDVESIYKKIESDKGREMYILDTIAGNTDKSDTIIDNIVLEEKINSLDKRERDIIKMRYMEEMTQSRVAEIIGVSQVQISRLEKKILKKLREGFNE